MPKFKVEETFTNGVRQNTYISAVSETAALEICTAIYGGQHQAFEESTSITTEQAALTPVSYKRAKIMLKNVATSDVTFFDLVVKATVSDLDIEAALKNKTINGVNADTVTVLSINKVTV